ncbi:thioredoxin domain-containing protein [Saccharobesus litoralis]|uniref:thioredoxin domain-containing protein n=1 Tax=Saccharobesus litoralis TaxID=2172099 RepID=UPI00131ED4BB|nr:DUF255 domain-containing protein [Saccharobesus litoralis]
MVFSFAPSLIANEFIAPPNVENEITADTFQAWQSLAEQKRSDLVLAANQQPTYLNRLIQQNAAYLLRHATNPINWYAWGPEPLQYAKQSNKLIFLSIGYSTCHWCHVMEQESFSNIKIGRLLAHGYVAIKVDRELSPVVDSYYKDLLAALTGQAGWPINAILTPDGQPLFVSAYLDFQQLSQLLRNTRQAWQQNRQIMQTRAEQMLLLANKKPVAQASDWQPSLINSAIAELKPRLDDKYGGLQGQQKFPTEAALLFQLKYLQIEPDQELADKVQTQLDNMLGFGLYDAIDGGFHRYSTDAKWHVPHYEKMAYNQGLMLQVYSLAYRVFGKPEYLALVDDLVGFIDSDFYLEGSGFASAIDAVYQSVEGGYYLWERSTLETLKRQSPETAEELFDVIPVGQKFQLYFKSPFTAQNQVLRTTLKHKRKAQIQANQKKPFIDTKIVVAWNGYIIQGLIDAYRITGNPRALAMATNAAQSIARNQFSAAQQILSRSEMLTAKTSLQNLATPATLIDYAALANAYLSLYELAPQQNKHSMQLAEQLAQILVRFFADQTGLYNTADQRFSSAILASSVSHLTDGETFNGNAELLILLHRLVQIQGSGSRWLNGYEQLKNSLQGHFSQAKGYAFGLAYALLVDLHKATPIKYFANGHGQAQTLIDHQLAHRPEHQQANCAGATVGEVHLRVKLAPGWHINSNQPQHAHLKATQVSLLPTTVQTVKQAKTKLQVTYPKPVLVQTEFEELPLSLFEGEFTLAIKRDSLIHTQTQTQKLSFEVQACNDQVCLFPEQLVFPVNPLPVCKQH